MDKYIGLDVHATSCTAAIVDARGKRLGHHVLETNGQVLVEFFKTLKGTLHVCARVCSIVGHEEALRGESDAGRASDAYAAREA